MHPKRKRNKPTISTTQSLCWVVLFIALYWGLTLPGQSPQSTPVSTSHSIYSASLSTLNRDDIHRALNGDAKMIIELIILWQQETPCLTEQEIAFVKTWKPQPHKNRLSLFPQTYSAASYMLALAPHSWIMAIPKGLRFQTSIFPSCLTKSIENNTDLFDVEKLYLSPPGLSVVTTYTNPRFITTLHTLDLPYYAQKPANSCNTIISSITELGTKIGCENKAKLMTLFIKSSLHAIDKRFSLHHQLFPDEKYLITFYEQGWSLPTKHSLTGHLLQRAGINYGLPASSSQMWYLPTTLEALYAQKPTKMILAADPNSSIFHPMLPTKKISFVDHAIQKSPTQHIVLAYFDLLAAVKK